ncbi:hypothetical protein G6O69_13175 [Pseudenhygromyxa sp. WMMC2535]|uniref:hypothetical protein n=1 Tax=Pseudenhygromyxa sp. WMMC2535 TaxID=2712867 RepID=UPI001558212C|nr:hypothetical protein [Pseudenhygromyxa sp. WMMC2535]NVB38786.1 hypothetical protein [Pseudenhygromyxa sp. WMMC2535]
MDYVGAEKLRPKLRTGSLPGLPWRSLTRRDDLEDRMPALILLSFAMLAAIQLLLRG